MTKQTAFFGSICLTIFALTSSIHGRGLTGDDIVDQARVALVSYEQGDRMAYYRLDATRDERLFPVFLEALNHSDANVRILAVNQLTDYRKEETIGPISALLKHDRNAQVRAAAASSLGQLGYQQGRQFLLDSLNDESPNVVEAAMRGLGWLKSEEAVVPLTEKLRGDNEKDWVIQRAAADALRDITGEDWGHGIHEYPPELRVRDTDVTFEAYQRAMEYLGKRVPELIDTTITTEELTSEEKFYIGYWNHLTIIEGYHLKQSLQIQKGALQQTLQSQKLNGATEDDVVNARKAYDEALQKYEDFFG